MIANLTRLCRLLLEVTRLPVARLNFDTGLNPDDVIATHRNFTRPHPKYKVFGHKAVGAALIDLRRHASAEAYVSSIAGRRFAASYAHKARTRGYVLARIDRNVYVDQIHAINVSLESRQGRPMDAQYQEKQLSFPTLSNYHYYGVLAADGRLMAYGNLGLYGNFAAFSRLIGYRNNDGVMHLLVVDIVRALIEDGSMDYLMYDTLFGAQPGMRQFKTMLGFQPYRVKYSIR